MSTLSSCSPYYVRCLKPNLVQRPSQFDTQVVQEQLKYLGIMETIKVRNTPQVTFSQIRRMGFATRFNFNDFYARYRVVVPGMNYKDKAVGCSKLIEAFSRHKTLKNLLPQVQQGVTKMFLKAEVVSSC